MLHELEVTQEQVGDIIFFSIRGPIDAKTIDELDGVLGPVFRGRNAKAVVDCPGVTYICSRGIGLLIEYHRQCCIGSGRMIVSGMTPPIFKALERLRADAVLHIVPTREHAVQALQE